MWLLSYVSFMINTFLFLDEPIIKPKDIVVISPTDEPEMVLPTAIKFPLP